MALFTLSFSRVVVAIFVLGISYWAFNMYNLFVTASCTDSRRCLKPAYPMKKKMQFQLYTSINSDSRITNDMILLFNGTDFKRNETWTFETNVTLPLSTLGNGSLYIHVFLGPQGKSLTQTSQRQRISIITVPVTKYLVASAAEFNLVTGEYESVPDNKSSVPTTHWIPELSFYGVGDDWYFDSRLLPPELWITNTLQLLPGTMTYLPIIYCNELRVLNRDLKLVSSSNTTMPLSLSYSPVGLGQLRIWIQFRQALRTMATLGFPEKELDTMKELIFGTNLYLLGLTCFISFFHMLFDFLAFKNDISFWRKRKTTVGLSRRTVIWRCFSYTVVFLYLMEEETSLLIQVPAGIGAAIEYWKVWKALKLKIEWSNGLPKLKIGQQIALEEQTDRYDSQAMKYLTYVLIPLVLLGAVYCLAYLSYKSWYSWLIHSLVNGVYAFGFIFMLPQLFVNYKLKSVAHLPWRAFMYKAFNTFIDDVFAFIITMPTSHRVAVFRDDVVFLVYLYQRWLYPVDKNRINEYGESFEHNETHVAAVKKQQ